MRAGKLHHRITIERQIETRDEYGVPKITTINPVGAPIRAQIIDPSREEFYRAYGQAEETITIFRTRFLADLTTADTVDCAGLKFDIKQVTEIGRRKGLELRTVRRAGQ